MDKPQNRLIRRFFIATILIIFYTDLFAAGVGVIGTVADWLEWFNHDFGDAVVVVLGPFLRPIGDFMFPDTWNGNTQFTAFVGLALSLSMALFVWLAIRRSDERNLPFDTADHVMLGVMTSLSAYFMAVTLLTIDRGESTTPFSLQVIKALSASLIIVADYLSITEKPIRPDQMRYRSTDYANMRRLPVTIPPDDESGEP